MFGLELKFENKVERKYKKKEIDNKNINFFIYLFIKKLKERKFILNI